MRGAVFSARYELVDKLGAGGMGEVWRARDLGLGREVAVKIFSPPEDVQDEERTELLGRFRREARAAAALDSPHIATIHDHGAHDTVPYLVMELVEGRSLEQVVRDEGRVPVERALSWAVQICRALGTAHAAGVVHRDIKPANIMIRPDGTAVVLDFGIAKFQEAVEAESKLTRTGHMPLGSVLYMAPERFRMETGDGREDLYALGCVLYELLVGRPPFVGPAAGVMYNHLHDTPLRPSRARAELPSAVDRLVLDLMAKNPDDRPADAEQAAARLDDAAGKGPEAKREPQATSPAAEPEPEREPERDPGPEPEPEPESNIEPRPTGGAPSGKMLAGGILVTAASVVAIGAMALLDVELPDLPRALTQPENGRSATQEPPYDAPVLDDSSGPPGAGAGAATRVPRRYTLVYLAPSADDAAAEPLKRALKEVGDGLKLDVEVDTSDSKARELLPQRFPDAVAVVGDTSLVDYDTGLSKEKSAQPVTVDTCSAPGEPAVPDSTESFVLQPRPGRVADQLAGYLRRTQGARTTLLDGPAQRGGFKERFRESVSEHGDSAPVSDSAAGDDSSALAQEADRTRADAVLFSGFAAGDRSKVHDLLKSRFKGPVLAPGDASHGCDTFMAPAGTEVDPELKGLRRYRSGPDGARGAESRAHDAALAVVTALARQRGAPTVGQARERLAEDLRKIDVKGELGSLAFDKDGYLKDRPLWIDRADGEHWREERKLTPP